MQLPSRFVNKIVSHLILGKWTARQPFTNINCDSNFPLGIETNNNNCGELCKKAESSLTSGCCDHVAPEIKHGHNLSIKTDVYRLGYC